MRITQLETNIAVYLTDEEKQDPHKLAEVYEEMKRLSRYWYGMDNMVRVTKYPTESSNYVQFIISLYNYLPSSTIVFFEEDPR